VHSLVSIQPIIPAKDTI